VTVLAKNHDYIVEFEPTGQRLLTIARRSDGYCLAFTGARVAGEFRDCLKTHDLERIVQTYERIARGVWRPLYKASAMPRLLDTEDLT
jgi:hypothetical protein